jgi:HEAT repeat protein
MFPFSGSENNQEKGMARLLTLELGLGILLAVTLRPTEIDGREQEAKIKVFEGKPLSDWIVAALDPNPEVQKRVTATFDTVIIPTLIERTKATAFSTRYGALSDLGQIGPRAKAAVTAILIALQDDEPVIRVVAAGALKQVDPQTKEAMPVLLAALRTKNNNAVRSFAAGAFAQFGEEAVQPILQVLPDLDPPGQTWAATSLAMIGKPALPRLIRALEDKNPVIRGRSAAAIADMEITAEEARAAIPALRRLVRDPEPSVRAEAEKALRRWQK